MKESSKLTNHLNYDFLFIGLGAANSLLILSLYKNKLLEGKNIAIIDPSKKLTDDKTFCFWSTKEELHELNIEELVSHSWDHIEIKEITKQNINPLKYQHIKGVDLSTKTKEILSLNEVTFYRSPMNGTPNITLDYCELKFKDLLIRSTYVFDSRPPSFSPLQKNQSHLFQSFLGWKIKTSKAVFDTASMTMMDFKIDQNNSTQFIYILPFEKNSALIELTRFGQEKLTEKEAAAILQNYIQQLDDNFEITEHELGIIPMSTAMLNVDNYGNNWINMGARANQLKCTTGYAFHAMAEDAIQQMEAIKANKLTTRKPNKRRFYFYDRLLLKILSKTPKHGKNIFETLFEKVPAPTVLKFMREKTNFKEEVFLFSKLPKKLFIKAAIKDTLHRTNALPILALPFIFTVLALILSFYHLEFISWGILAIGFLSVGLAHGALDHLTGKEITTKKQLLYFVMNYLLKGFLFALVWWLSSDIALALFILYSAWHFGQADFKEWNFNSNGFSFLWGIVVLMMILFFHTKELIVILQQIPNLSSVKFIKTLSSEFILSIQLLTVTTGLFLSYRKESTNLLLTLVYLLLASKLSLLLSFGIYFVGQHSLTGWRHLSVGLNKSSSNMWKNAFPFTLGGLSIIIYFLFFMGENYTGIFFIILSCLSLPHVFSMHHFYKLFRKKNNIIN
tara:strand:+ start:7971 stop:10001 length:2031 start_codon:yes stop_codon:yes gene_type:complete